MEPSAWTVADAGNKYAGTSQVLRHPEPTKEVTMPDGTKAAELDWANNYTFDSTVNGALSNDPQGELKNKGFY